MRAPEERIRRSVNVTPSGCWEWLLATNRDGYGRITLPVPGVRGGKSALAHRVSFETFVGAIPRGLQLDHLCRNRACVNPAHLEPVTPRENTLRGTATPAINACKTHCDHGHEFTPENTYVRPSGDRQCRACRADAQRRYAQRKNGVAA